MSQTRDDLRSKTASAFSWGALGSVVRAIAGFVTNLVLARLLDPTAFGVMAIALLLLSLGNLVTDLGLTTGLIQRKEAEDCDVAFVFTAQVGVGLLFSAVLLALAGPLSAYFHQPRLATIMPVVALTAVIQAAAFAPIAVLQRRLDLRSVQVAQVLSYLLGYVLVGLPLAICGCGLWSLVLAQVVQASVVLAILLKRASLRPYLSVNGAPDLVRFGSHVLGANLLNWAFSNVDTTLVGLCYGASTLGVYDRVGFIGVAVGFVLGAAQGTLLSGGARIRDDLPRLRRAFVGTWQLVALATWPMLIALSAVPYTTVVGLYGSKWAAGSEFVPPLACSLALNALLALSGPALMAIGEAKVELRQVARAFVLGVPIMIVAGHYSLMLLLWSIVLARFIFLVLITAPLVRALEVPTKALLLGCGRALLVGSLIAGMTLQLDRVASGLPASLRVALLALCGLGMYTLVFVVFPKVSLSSEALTMLQGIGPFRRLARD